MNSKLFDVTHRSKSHIPGTFSLREGGLGIKGFCPRDIWNYRTSHFKALSHHTSSANTVEMKNMSMLDTFFQFLSLYVELEAVGVERPIIFGASIQLHISAQSES